MINWQNHAKARVFIKTVCSILIVTFSLSNIQYVQAQDFNVNQLPMPGTMVDISSPFAPLALKGMIINPTKPLEFQFIVDTGRGPQDTASVKDEAKQLVKYFLAGITIPEGDLWVNLSPYEKNRIVPSALGQTDLGRDLLAQDYILKQLTASLIYPEKDLGKEFWSRVYAKAQEQFGTTNVPVNTFNKVWILPAEAQVFENNNAVYVTKSTLKVMLDEDYVAKQKHQATQASSISSQIVREIVLPEIEKEVNTGKNFAPLRQIYQALILAKWYKETIQNGLMDALYTNKKKVAGVNVDDPAVKEEIYQRYLKAYKKGAFNYIKEDPTPDGQVVPRKYFSGGITQMGTFPLMRTHDGAMLSNGMESGDELFLMTVNCDTQNDLSKSSAGTTIEKTNPFQIKKSASSFRNAIKKMALGLMIATPLLFASAGSAKAAVITPNSNGTLHVAVQNNDTFGQILLDAGYKTPLWGTDDAVSQLKNSVESQIPSHDINHIGPGVNFNIPNPHAVTIDPDVNQYMQQLSHAISHLKTSSRLFSTNDLKGLDQVLSNIPQKVLGNEQANKAINEIKQARADMNSTFFRLNLKGANLAGQHTGDTQLFSLTKDGQTQLKIVGDIHRHLKTAKDLMKPLVSGKNKGTGFNMQGNVRVGPVTVHLPGISVAPIPSHEGPIGLSGKVTVGGGNDNQTNQLNKTNQIHSTQVNPDMQKAVDQIHNQLGIVTDELAQLQQSHSNLLVEDTDLRVRLNDAQQQIEGLKATQKVPDGVTQLENKIDTLDHQITDLKIQQDKDKETATAKIKSLEDNKQRLETQASDLKDKVTATENSINQVNTRISSLEEYNNHWWQNIGTGWKAVLSILGALGIGAGLLRYGLYKNWQRLQQVKQDIIQKEEEKQNLDDQIAAQKQMLNGLEEQVKQATLAVAEITKKRGEHDAELQKTSTELSGLKEDVEKLRSELGLAVQEKSKVIEDFERKESQLKASIVEKQASLDALVREEAAKKEPPKVKIEKIEPPEVNKGVEYLQHSNTKLAKGLLHSEKIDLQARIRFVHDELGFDIANGKGRSLLSRSPDFLIAQKTFLESLGLPLTVSNLSSSKKSFAKKELIKIVKNPQWQELNNSEKLSVVSYLYDIYGLRTSWLQRDNDWYQLLHYFELSDESISYTPRSIDFIQRYELARFQKFSNVSQTKYRLSKIKEIIELLNLKVVNLLNVVTTNEGFKLYVVRPEVLEGKEKYDEQDYPLPKTPFTLGDIRIAGEVEEGTIDPQDALTTGDLGDRLAALKQEITQKQTELENIEAEKQKKITELDSQISTFTVQRDKLLEEIAQLQETMQEKRRVSSLEVTQQEEKLATLKSTIADLEKEQGGLEQSSKDLQKTVRELQDLIQSLEGQKNKSNQELSALGDIKAARGQAEEANRQLQQAQDNQRQLQETIDALTLKKQNLETELGGQEEQKRKFEAEVSGLSTQAENLQQRITELQNQKIELVQKERNLSGQIEAKAGHLKGIEEQIAGLEEKSNSSGSKLTDLRNQKRTLETEIAELSQHISELSSNATEAQTDIEVARSSLAGLEDKKRTTAENLQELEKTRQGMNTEIVGLESQRSQLGSELERLRQEFSSLQQDATAKRESLNTDITRNQQTLNQLNLNISTLNGQKAKLDQEIGEIQRKKQQEIHDLEKLVSDKEEINKKIAQARQQLGDYNTQIQSYSGTLDEMKQRGVSLNQEVPALISKRDALRQELSVLEQSKQEIEAGITRARQESQSLFPMKPAAVVLPKPYTLMIFDVDNTLTDITSEINQDVLNQLLEFLGQNVRIALVTAQSMDEVTRYIINRVPADKKRLLTGLTVYPAGGAKCYTFNAQGQPINENDYDTTVGLTLSVKPTEVEESIRRMVGSGAGIGLRDGLITITGLTDRDRTYGELTSLFKEEGWHLVPRLAGGHSIHVLIGGVSKAKAATHFVKELGVKTFGQQIPNSQILVVGDSFYAGGLDADLISALPQADVVSVGKKPQGKQLRDLNAQGLLFSDDLVGGRNWQATLKILKEVRKGKPVRQITRGSSGGGFASFMLVLAASALTLFPTGLINAQTDEPRPAIIQAGNGVNPIDDVFTLDNYINHIDKIIQAIKQINDSRINSPKIREGLKWIIVEAQLPDQKFYPDIVKDATAALLKLGDDGIATLVGALAEQNLIHRDVSLKIVFETIVQNKPNELQLGGILDSLEQLAFRSTNSDQSYNGYMADIATKTLIQLGDAGISRIKNQFNSSNYRTMRTTLFQAIVETGLQDPEVIQKMYWVVLEATLQDGHNSSYPSITEEAGKALYKIQDSQAISKFTDALTSGSWRAQDGGAWAILAIARTQAGNLNPGITTALQLIKKLDASHVDDIHNPHKTLSQEADELLNANAPIVPAPVVSAPVVPQHTNIVTNVINQPNQSVQTKVPTIDPSDLRGKLFFHTDYKMNAQALRDYYQDKPWTEKYPNYLLCYIADWQIWVDIAVGIIGAITGLVIWAVRSQVNDVYKQLVNFVGPSSDREQKLLRKAAVKISKKLEGTPSEEDIYNAIVDNLPEIYKITKNEHIERIVKFIDKLNRAKVNSKPVLRYGLRFMAKATKDENEFEQGLNILSDTAIDLQKHNISTDSVFDSGLDSLKGQVTELSVFQATCKLISGLSSQKQNIQNVLTKVLPQAFETAKDANTKVASTNIILNLFSDGIYPTQLLIETLQKTTSGGNLTQQITKMSSIFNDFKRGTIKFDINNPIHVELEYTTYRQLAGQLSQSDDYENYKSLIQQFRSHSDSPSGLESQERAEVKLAVYEAYRLLEYIVAIKDKADKIGRPVWVVPNLTYGKFAVSPILDELGKLNIEVHYAKVGSTGAHEHPEYTVPSLFTDDVYFRILKERPILIVVDGTQHLMPRPEEGKSSRYPDAHVGYRNLITAVDEVISEGKAEKFLDKVHISNDFLSTLHENSDYTGLVDNLKRLNATLDQPQNLYKLGFWNPAGLPLVVREARKEVQKVNIFNPDDLDSPTLLFINSPLLDEDLPADIKQWAGLEQSHIPAYFDDKTQIQQTTFAVNDRGVFLSDSLDFESHRASEDMKQNYRGRLPQIVYQQPTPQSLRAAYEAMLFDLDGTLTDTLSEIDKSVLNKLIYFLNSGVVIGIVTSQSLDEVKKYILDKVDGTNAQALRSLIIFTARGGQAWSFDQNKNPVAIYDVSQKLADNQKKLIRQVVNQAVGSLAPETDITDRQAQITIRLKKNKDKRDAVNTTLTQLIKANNLPFETEYSGNSTIHVIMRGVDKGTAKDYFVSKIIPQKLNHQVDVSKLLIVGDRFQDNGSDKPMIVSGARVVSVGSKDKNVPGVEAYAQHGWKGTNQLLGDIITKTGRTTVTFNSFTGFFGLSGLLQGVDDDTRNYLFLMGAGTIGVGLLAYTCVYGIKYYKAYKIHSQIKQVLNFLDSKDSRRLYKAVYRYLLLKKNKDIDPYQLLVDVLPEFSRDSQDRRLVEIANLATRLSKAGLDPRHVFKYTLGPITAKTSDQTQILNSLKIVEQLALALNDKHFDYHQLLKEIMPSVSSTVRSIDELNESLLLGITILSSGRNPTFALTQMLPEVTALSNTFTDFKLGMYALQQLCLEGFEPTKYLIQELIKQGQTQAIDKTVADWLEIKRKFKTGEVAFDPQNQLYVNIEYTTFRELVDRTLKQTHKYSFTEYLDILKNSNNNNNHAHLRRTEKAEIKYAAYEAFRFREFVLEVKERADKMGKKVWVVPNLSYGRFAVSPITKDLGADGVEIHYARIGSTESHENSLLVKPELFSADLYARIMNEQPIIIVVDGTQHLLARPKDRKSGRYPDAYVGYRNMVITVNDLLSQNQEQMFKGLVKTSGTLIRDLRKKSNYRTLRRRLFRLFNPNLKTKRYLYDVEFWNPGDLELAIRQDRKEVDTVRNVSADNINQPTLIFVNSVMLDEDVPPFIRDWINRDKMVHHKPAYFDDTSHIQNLIFDVDNFGVSLSDQIYDNIRKEYKRLKGIYQPNIDISTKPLNLPKLPYKAVISDLDGTLAHTLQEVPKPVMDKLLYLMGLGVQVAIVTTQSYKEVEKYFLSQVPGKYKALLSNLTIYPATGSQGFGFDANGDPLQKPLFDTSDVKLSDKQMDAWRGIINSLVKEYGLDNDVKDKKGKVVSTPAKIIDAGSQIILRLKERGFLRREIFKRLQADLNREGLPILLKEIGNTSIRMTIKGINKSIAVDYHLTQVCKAKVGFAPKPQEVLVLGNSFDEEGDDRDLMIPGARVFSVGHKPFMNYLRGGVNFYPEGGWRGSDQILAELINLMQVKINDLKNRTSQPVRLNSFIFLPFLATGGGMLNNLDPYTSFVLGCLTGIAATIMIFQKKIFGPEETDEQDNTEDVPTLSNSSIPEKRNRILQAITQRFVAPKLPEQRKQVQFLPVPRKQTDFNKVAEEIKGQYPGLKIGIIGAASPTKGYDPKTGIELGKKLRAYVGDKGFVFTGGVPGVGEDVYQGVVEASNGGDDRFFVLLPDGMFAGGEYRHHSVSQKVRTANFGQDMFERRIGMGKVADVVIILNGRGGTLHEAAVALENGKKIIALNYGGAGSLLYQAKANGLVPVVLEKEGIKQEYLENIINADLDNIEQVLDALTGNTTLVKEESQIRIPNVSEVKKILQDSIKVKPSDEDIVSVVGRNSTSRWYSAVRRTVNTVLKHPLTVYYPGPWKDITHPLLTTDGDVFLFVDVGESNMTIDKLISSISGQILKLGGYITDKEIVSDTQAVLDFEYQGRERRLYYYNKVDASNPETLPQKVKDGFDVYAEKLLSTGYTGAGTKKDEVLKVALPYLRKGGFLLTDYRVRDVVDDPRLNTVGIEYVKEIASPDWMRFNRLTYFSDEAQVSQKELKDFAMTLFPLSEQVNTATSKIIQLKKGGIDLNKINIKRSGKIISIQFDPAQLNAIEQGGFEGFTPVITNIIRIQNPLPLFGVNNTGMLVKEVHKEFVSS
jgi:HAD superfamily hydrolase (TIGR01484 family)